MSLEKTDIDHTPITEGVFIDDDSFSNTDIKAKDKQNIRDILQPVNHSDISIAQPIFEIKEKNSLKPAKKEFNDIWLPKKSLIKGSRVISKKYEKLEQKKDQLQFLKQVPMHSSDVVKLIKQFPLHPQDRLVCKTRDMYDDMETVDYNPPLANDELL